MTQQEYDIFDKYIQAGRTLVRYSDRYDSNEFEIQGIVMETFPYATTDDDSFNCAHAEMLMVAWFDGSSNTFPICILDFDIGGEWWDIDDILMAEK